MTEASNRLRTPTWIPTVAIWVPIAAACGVIGTQIFGVDGTGHVAALQALSPYLLLGLAPLAVIANRTGRHVAGIVASLAGLMFLALAAPLVFPTSPAAADDAVGVRVGVVNLLYSNERTTEIADELARRDLDVIVLTELTPSHLERLDEHELADGFPHRAEQPGSLASGVAIWSRFPVSAAVPLQTESASIDARLAGPDGEFRLIAVHPPTPIYDFDGWRTDLDVIGDAIDVATAPPTLVAGDFNASYWHPRFRDLLDRGLTDAHIAHRQGWSMSWPTDVAIPPYVRLDHALTGRGLVSTAIDDFRVAGSDHAGFVVSVAPERRTAT